MTAMSSATPTATRVRTTPRVVVTIAIVAFAVGLFLGNLAIPATHAIGSGVQQTPTDLPASTFDLDQIRAGYRRH